MKARFVFDATPLIHLAKAGLAPMISGMEGEKFTAPAVVNEVVGNAGGRRLEHADAVITSLLIEEGTLQVKAPPADTVKRIKRVHPDIHPGESEVLALAKELDAVAIVDDRVARSVARIQRVRVEGTYGIVIRAAVKGSVSLEEAEDALGRLVSSGWRCDAELYGALLKLLKKKARR